MTQLNQEIKFDDSFLFSGDDLRVTDNIIVKHPSVDEIIHLSESYNNTRLYWNIVSTIICDPYLNMVMLDDYGLNYLEVTPFDVFAIQWAKCEDLYKEKSEMYDKYGLHPLDLIKKALNFFLGFHNFNLIQEDYQFYLVDEDSKVDGIYKYVVNKEMYNMMSEFVFNINNLTRDDRINPANESTRKMLVEDMREEQNRKLRKNSEEDYKDYIGITSKSLCFGGNGTVSVFNYKQLKIYQLFSGMKITDRKENSNQLISGIYAGNIKSEGINKKDLKWKE